MYIQLVDEHNSKSPLLYIHADEDEFMAEIEEWRQDLFKWAKNPEVRGLPLGRLEANTCIVDLMRHLTAFYVESTELSFAKGRVFGTLRLLNESYLASYDSEEVIEISLVEA